MKPNDKQIKVAKIIPSQGSFWQSTNDINSPTHYCDIGETCTNCEVFGELTENEARLLNDKLTDLYFFVKSLK